MLFIYPIHDPLLIARMQSVTVVINSAEKKGMKLLASDIFSDGSAQDLSGGWMLYLDCVCDRLDVWNRAKLLCVSYQSYIRMYRYKYDLQTKPQIFMGKSH